MSAAAAIAAATAIDTDVRQLATDVGTLKALIAAARTSCVAAGKNSVNEVDPHGTLDLLWSEVARVMIDAGLRDFLAYVEMRGINSIDADASIASYGALWTTRCSASIGTYI